MHAAPAFALLLLLLRLQMVGIYHAVQVCLQPLA